MGGTASRLLFLAFCAGAFLGLAAIALIDPSKGLAGTVDVCAFHSVTGLHCAGCGTTRAIHALLHGDVLQALAYNPLMTAFAPFAVYLVACWGLSAFGRRPLPLPKLGIGMVVAIIIMLVGFTVARNLPWGPMKALAPHELPKAQAPQK